MTFSLTSASFEHGAEIPVRHTCDGEDISPALTWAGTPDGTKSLALIVDDPDAPDPEAPTMTWVHWVVYNLPPSVDSLAEGVESADLPPPAREGLNDWKRPGYRGPCPPIGRHRYFHKLYALDCELPEEGAISKAELERRLVGHVLAKAELVGTYRRGEQPG